MKRIYKGKTKDVYTLDEKHVLLKFKDDVTGSEGTFDPGADTIGLTIPGSGQANVRLSTYFFEKFAKEKIPTHFISANLEKATMKVLRASSLGKGIEVIVRNYADGSFVRRYGDYCKKHDPLDGLIEFTLKDDLRKDPPITKNILIALNILNEKEYDRILSITKKVSSIVERELHQRDLLLYDIKFEFGRHPNTKEIILIDEISAGNMRVYQNKKQIPPILLNDIFFNEKKD